MKYKHLFLSGLVFVCLWAVSSYAYMQNNLTNKLGLKVESSKETYKLGEIVSLSFELENKSKEPLAILDVFGIGTGHLSVYLSQNNKTFQNYNHPDWGLLDLNNALTVLKPSESAKTKATVLWKWKPENSEYAFPSAGEYYLKANYYAYFEERADPILIESEPIKITIEEPIGEDLEVWNKIKDNGDFASFIQEGDFRIPSYKTEKRAKFQKEIEQIINQYPESFYAQSLKQSLDKFKANEEKRKTDLQKLHKEKRQ